MKLQVKELFARLGTVAASFLTAPDVCRRNTGISCLKTAIRTARRLMLARMSIIPVGLNRLSA
jgi:hypothetical protein